jgi:hypothetical protein
MRGLKLWLIRRGYRNAETQRGWREISELTLRLSPMLAANDPVIPRLFEAET